MTYIRPLTRVLPKYALTALAILMAGCSSQTSVIIPAESAPTLITEQERHKELESQLLDASRTLYPERARLTLPITGELLKSSPARAKELLDQMPYHQLPSSLQAQVSLQQALIAQSNNQNWEVFNWLDRESVITSQDRDLQRQVYALRAQAYLRFGEYRAALDEWLTGLPMFAPPEQPPYYDAFWQTLLHASPDHLQELSGQVLPDGLQGWIALAQIYQPGNTLENQLTHLQRWQQEWPGHPASIYLPDNFDTLRYSAMERPRQIAVLLPLSGTLGKAGRSVRDGIIAANYEAMGKEGADNREATPHLQFYDTYSADINSVANAAISEGAQLIIGPLTKSNVARLSSDTLNRIPLLALNYLDERQDETSPLPHHPNLFQFGLSADDEARLAAQRGHLDGHLRAVVITPDTPWGKKINATFTQSWSDLGGVVADSGEFQPKTEFSAFAGQLLHTDQSQKRANQLNRLLGKKLGFRPRRRQDVDMIFIGANPAEARQLKPALAYQFAGNIPVYSTSSAFSGTNNPSQNQDMDGIRIPVMPWLTPGVDSPLKQQITRLWPQSNGQYGTLYALGADAYRLYPHLQQLSALQGSQIQGLTGRLSLSTSGKVHRELSWQLFRNGRLVPLPISRKKAEHVSITEPGHVLATKTQ